MTEKYGSHNLNNSMSKKSIRIYLVRVLIALDQLANSLVGGYPNETLSSRAWRRGQIEGKRTWEIFQSFIDWLFKPIEDHHCEQSYLYCKKPTKIDDVYFPVICECERQKYVIPIDLIGDEDFNPK